jgi:hypothetical protein
MAGEKAGDLADLISRLWRHGRSTQTRQSTAEAATSQETQQPLAEDLQQLWDEQVVNRDGEGRVDPGQGAAG